MKVISTFSGCGGSSLGYKMAGCNVIAAVEFIQSAAECYSANHPTTKVYQQDIRTLDPQKVMDDLGLLPGDLDILDGSPPCASFSQVGKKDKLWGVVKDYSETKQRVDDLFFEYVRMVRGLRPKVFVAENVKQLTQGKSKPIFDEIMSSLTGEGYKVHYAVLPGYNFGVPQERARVYIVGIRDDIWHGDFLFPLPTTEESDLSVKAALEGLDNDLEEVRMLLDAGNRYANMQKWDEIPKHGMWHPTRFNVGRNRWELPSFAITATDSRLSAAGLCHPFEKRRHTVAEMKRLMGFPDDYILTGTWQQKVERLGRSVMPPVIAAIATQIKEYLGTGNHTGVSNE